ncbi:17166_t:CDS:2 [Acaulospora morrowiae]|uniref:17166_t:CDS:1 n=1 Tax=Acaulospora morrowiae TaxID=94023 RepID=A0A9N9A9M9_9GLOM|nr:17166_t:CDS:2 [Acaulospora morrowiae]
MVKDFHGANVRTYKVSQLRAFQQARCDGGQKKKWVGEIGKKNANEKHTGQKVVGQHKRKWCELTSSIVNIEISQRQTFLRAKETPFGEDSEKQLLDKVLPHPNIPSIYGVNMTKKLLVKYQGPNLNF